MARPRNPLELRALLPGSNCGRCAARTCVAFAAGLVDGGRRVTDCPHLDQMAAAGIAAYLAGRQPAHHDQATELQRLRDAVATVDFPSVAVRLGAAVVGDGLVVKSLGRDFRIGRDGRIASDCHTHAGLAIPLLRYVIYGRGGSPGGAWVPFRELAGAAGRELHFARMCEQPLKRLVDADTGLLKDLIDIFSGERSVNLFSSDISLVLYPLPRLPVLICYWGPEEGMDSSLHIFFDATATDHLDAAWIHSLSVGLVAMFGKIADRHR